MQRDGRIVIARGTESRRRTEFELAQFTLQGARDRSFSGDGRQLTGFGTAGDYGGPQDLALQRDGRIVVVGTVRERLALARYRNGAVIRGTPGSDRLVGTSGDDLITCGAGDDRVSARGGKTSSGAGLATTVWRANLGATGSTAVRATIDSSAVPARTSCLGDLAVIGCLAVADAITAVGGPERDVARGRDQGPARSLSMFSRCSDRLID